VRNIPLNLEATNAFLTVQMLEREGVMSLGPAAVSSAVRGLFVHWRHTVTSSGLNTKPVVPPLHTHSLLHAQRSPVETDHVDADE